MCKISKYALILEIMLSSCGAAPAPSITAPDDVMPYVNYYLNVTSSERLSSGTITVDAINATWEGVCYQSRDGNPWAIHLNSTYWTALSVNQKRALVAHELTHCLYASGLHSPSDTHYMYMALTFTEGAEVLSTQIITYTKNLK